jgi:U4/U6.U5 tri-snRNP-associated protein 2
MLCRNILHFCFAEIKATTSPFLFLAVDLPPPPLFQDAVEKNIIPQVGIHSVLAKYDGVNTQVEMIHCAFFLASRYLRCSSHTQESRGQLRRFNCQQLPQYLIIHYKRFTKNNFVEEKNPTIVNFPLKGVDFRDCQSMRLVHPVFKRLLITTHRSELCRAASCPCLRSYRERNSRVCSWYHSG